MELDAEPDLQAHLLNIDQQLAKPERPEPGPLRKTTWKPLFFTKDLLKEYDELKLEEFALQDRHLRRLGAQIAADRQRIIQNARDVEKGEKDQADNNQADIDKYAKKLKSRAYLKVVGGKEKISNEFKFEKTIHKRKRSRTGKKLTLEEKIDISHKVICQNELQADIAKSIG